MANYLKDCMIPVMSCSWISNYFEIEARGSTLRQEVLAGFTTFSTMAYIIFVNPSLLSQAGMDFGGVMVATALAAGFATLIMGLYANYPFALAPGMGLNAYFTFGVVLGMGYTWELALGAVFWSGLLFLVLNLLGIRQLIAQAVPPCLRLAVAGGMGLFLAFIGLQSVGLVVGQEATLVSLGDPTSPSALLTLSGMVVMGVLLARGVTGAILWGIIFNWLIALGLGYTDWNGIVSFPPNPMDTLGHLDIWAAWDLGLFTIVFAFLFVDLFDTTGTLLGIAEQGGFLDEKGEIPRVGRAMTADALGTMLGAFLGTSTVTTFLESASGVATGGRTGLVSVVVALLFFLSLFVEPVVSSIPAFATAPALIIIGAMLLSQLAKVKWSDVTEMIPAFIALVSIPLTFSIATGIGLGAITYPLLKTLSGKGREVHWFLWVIAGVFAFRWAAV